MEEIDEELPTRKPRKFLPDNLVIDSWEKLEPYFIDLKDRTISTKAELEEWLLDMSELDAVLEEDMAWRYIKMNIDTANEELVQRFRFFVNKIDPETAPFSHEFDKKLLSDPHLKELDEEKYKIYLRNVRKKIEIYREKNIPLFTKLQEDAQKYGSIAAKMTVNIDGEEITLQKAATYLHDTDRAKRQEVFMKVNERRKENAQELDELYSHLINLRQQVAKNAGFDNYRDYMFAAMGRFDYSVEDCFDFHESIRKEIVPINRQFLLERKEKMGVDPLRPWDTEVDVTGKPPLKPFETPRELIDKTIECFNRIKPFFGKCIGIMDKMGHLDLESKKGKAPGGFNYPLYEIGVPFIFMNAVGSFRDLITMVHEGGHAIHSFLSRDHELTEFKSVTSEVAELASMSMELISMEHWDVFFDNKDDLKRAKREQLEKILSVLPWVAIIDRFQHWIYENPDHTLEERTKKWLETLDMFSTNVVDWSGYEEYRDISWQKQLHLFEVPFYYIEYGMAQLGAIAVWRNYKRDPKEAILKYEEALSLGYTKSIGEIYETAGIKFDFSGKYVRELAEFVKGELEKVT